MLNGGLVGSIQVAPSLPRIERMESLMNCARLKTSKGNAGNTLDIYLRINGSNDARDPAFVDAELRLSWIYANCQSCPMLPFRAN